MTLKVWFIERTDSDDFSSDIIAAAVSEEAAQRFVAEQRSDFQKQFTTPYGLEDNWEYGVYEVEVIQ